MPQSALKDKALLIISDAAGEKTAALYQEYFKDKSDGDIVAAVTDVLTQQLGEKKAREIVDDLTKGELDVKP